MHLKWLRMALGHGRGQGLTGQPSGPQFKGPAVAGSHEFASIATHNAANRQSRLVLNALWILSWWQCVGALRLQQQLWHPCRRPCRSSFLERALATAYESVRSSHSTDG